MGLIGPGRTGVFCVPVRLPSRSARIRGTDQWGYRATASRRNTNLLVWRRMWTSTLLTGSVEVWTNLSTLLSLLSTTQRQVEGWRGMRSIRGWIVARRSRGDKTASSVSEGGCKPIECRSHTTTSNDGNEGDVSLLRPRATPLPHQATRQSAQASPSLPARVYLFYSYDLYGFSVHHINNY